jgi:hypothetical protein
MTVEWFSPRPGHYVTRYQGKTLEVIRNRDARDSHCYVAFVDKQAWPHACASVKQAKTRAMRWADNPALRHTPDTSEDDHDAR